MNVKCWFSLLLTARRVRKKEVERLPNLTVMGRTVPTWRYRFENELNGLEAYKRALPSSEKAGLEALMNGVRKRRTAGMCR